MTVNQCNFVRMGIKTIISCNNLVQSISIRNKEPHTLFTIYTVCLKYIFTVVNRLNCSGSPDPVGSAGSDINCLRVVIRVLAKDAVYNVYRYLIGFSFVFFYWLFEISFQILGADFSYLFVTSKRV